MTLLLAGLPFMSRILQIMVTSVPSRTHASTALRIAQATSQSLRVLEIQSPWISFDWNVLPGGDHVNIGEHKAKGYWCPGHKSDPNDGVDHWGSRLQFGSDWMLRCSLDTGSSLSWVQMSVWSHLASIMRDPQRTGIVRVVAQRDDASCSEVNMGQKFCGLTLA